MSELVRATVVDTIKLLSGLIANPEAVDKFAEFFNQIGERQFVMTVNDAVYKNPAGESELGCVVTITAHEHGQFEFLQGFMPVAEEMYFKTGKRYFTDFLVPELGTILQLEEGFTETKDN
ncbi:hypothetical protein [Burkholderia phage FLC9]|nr:hypothetical protein [Burkholderia phage FLC9]